MSSTIIGEPFQLYLGSTLAQKYKSLEAVYTTYDPDFPGYATVTAQSDGIHVWDLQSLHAIASYSVHERVTFGAPAFTLCVTEDGNRSVISYALIALAPGYPKEWRGCTIWVIRQSISGSTVAASEKTEVHLHVSPVQICGSGHPTTPLLLVTERGSLFLADTQADIKKQLDWDGDRSHIETFVFPRKSCGFVQDDVHSYNRVAITCCLAHMTLYIRLCLLGEEIVPVGTCEMPIASSTRNTEATISGLSCSPFGILSFIDSHGRWATYQLVSTNSCLVLTPISEDLHLCRLTTFKSTKPRHGLSVVSLGTSLALLAGSVEGTQDISLQVWDLSYGVLLATQSMTVPSEIPLPHLSLAVAGAGQILLTVSPSSMTEKYVNPKRSSIHIVPVDARLRSSIAAALGKTALTAEWLAPKTSDEPKETDESSNMLHYVREALRNGNAQRAEQAFLEWVDSHSSKEVVLGYEFVKKVFNIVLVSQPPTKCSYAPRITRCLLENAVVSTIMLNGRLITMLRQQRDWENLMFALTTVPDISEDELMASAKFLIDRRRKSENAMDVDASEGYAPPLWSYLFACVSYPFSAAPMRLAIRKHIPEAQDLAMVLEILETWIQGGTEHEVEALLKSMATNAKTSSSEADSPPYPKVIAFLHVLLDASFVALLQYQPSHEPLRRILSYIQPEITFLDNLEPLRGMLEPFAKAQLLKEKADTSKETPVEWRKRKKQLREQASLSVGLYRLEELAI